MSICTDKAAKTGRRLLFVGADSAYDSIATFEGIADFAREHHVDTLLIKVADGGDVWYGGAAGWINIRKAILSRSVGAIPYLYQYGNTYGALNTEISLLKEFIQIEPNIVVADMEAQYNAHPDWATSVCAALKPVPGMLLITTWADPNEQDWASVLRALDPAVDAYIPQQYTDWLAGKWTEFAADGATCLFPAVDLSSEFGDNHPVQVAQDAAKEGHAAIVVWHYDLAVQNPGLLDAVLAAFPGEYTIGEENMYQQVQVSQLNGHAEDIGNGQWKFSNGVVMGGAILSYWRWNGHMYRFGFPLTEEIHIGGEAHPEATMVVCERGGLCFDPHGVLDQPWIDHAQPEKRVYPCHLEKDPWKTQIDKIS